MCRRSDRTARPPFLNDQGQSVGFALVCLAKESGISENICLVTDVGPGSGRAIADRFAGGGYKVAMLARDLDQLNEISAQTDNAFGYPWQRLDLARYAHNLRKSALVFPCKCGKLVNVDSSLAILVGHEKRPA